MAVYGLTLASDARVLYAATHGRGIYRLKLPPVAAAGGPAAAPSPAPSPSPGPAAGTGKLTLRFIAAALRGKKHRYIKVRLVANRPVRLLARVRNEHGTRVGTRRLSVPAGRRVAFRVFLRRNTRIRHHRRWRLVLRATDAGGQLATASRRFRV